MKPTRPASTTTVLPLVGAAVTALVIISACVRLIDPPAAVYACSAQAPSCPEELICLLSADTATGICGPLEACVIVDDDGLGRPAADCTPCQRDDDPSASVCVNGRCEPTTCNDSCRTPRCGDGCVDTDTGEACDPPGQRVGDERCLPSCLLTRCGNGVVEEAEDCDDGNDNPADGCDRCEVRVWRREPRAIDLPVTTSRYRVHEDAHCVTRCEDADCTTVVEVAGRCGQPGSLGELLFAPTAVAISADDAVYVSDTGNDRVVRVAAPGLDVEVVLGGVFASFNEVAVPARNVVIERPQGLALDTYGNLYVMTQAGLRQVLVAEDGTVPRRATGGGLLQRLDACVDLPIDEAAFFDVAVVNLPEGGEVVVVAARGEPQTPPAVCAPTP
jgi:cysteine-rich repeat protein